jgi:hypothetical protein
MRGAANEGTLVALSADGNTALVGGPLDGFESRRGMGLHAQRRDVDPVGELLGTALPTPWSRHLRRAIG